MVVWGSTCTHVFVYIMTCFTKRLLQSYGTWNGLSIFSWINFFFFIISLIFRIELEKSNKEQYQNRINYTFCFYIYMYCTPNIVYMYIHVAKCINFFIKILHQAKVIFYIHYWYLFELFVYLKWFNQNVNCSVVQFH